MDHVKELLDHLVDGEFSFTLVWCLEKKTFNYGWFEVSLHAQYLCKDGHKIQQLPTALHNVLFVEISD
jgi:hypothetical protein